MPVLIAGLLLAVGLAACAPAPEPAPSSTGFASEEEAFAAAEETYRAYVDALNAVDLSDPDTFEGVYAWTTGELYATDRKNFSDWHARGYTLSGESRVTAVDVVTYHGARAVIESCYDVSDVNVIDTAGNSLVSDDRPDVQNLQVELVHGDTDTGLRIANISGSRSGPEC